VKPGSDKVIAAFEANNAEMVQADWSENNWVIAEFLHAVKQPTIPYYLFIPGNPSKEVITMRGLITGQAQLIDAINTVGRGT
jgi:thiol:disulfide interchange protein